MSEILKLLEAVQAVGASIRVDGADLKVRPAGALPPGLKERLKQHKAEILQRLELETRLQAASLSIAIDRATGVALLIFCESDAEAVRGVATVDKPFEVELTARQRRELLESLEYFERTTSREDGNKR
jgi:hypothetical protein